MAVVDGNGLPIGLHVDSAQPHELTLAKPTLATIRVPKKRGRPKTRPKELVADKAYDSAEFRHLARLGGGHGRCAADRAAAGERQRRGPHLLSATAPESQPSRRRRS